jgi:DNA invertase Pin-like site-specific DNA recombinase
MGKTREPFVAYIRVSTYYEEKISPDIQRSAIKAWADRNNAEITEWIYDLDVSGRKMKRQIRTALKFVEDRAARGIAVWRYSRFGRSRHANAVYLSQLEAVGGRLASATEAADTRTASTRATASGSSGPRRANTAAPPACPRPVGSAGGTSGIGANSTKTRA